MKKSTVLSLLLSLILMISSFSFNVSAANLTLYAKFSASSLTKGDINATVVLTSVPDDSVFVTLGYYTSSNILTSVVSKTVSNSGTNILTLTVPDNVTFGDYAKITAMISSSLEPVNIIGTSVIYCTDASITNIDTLYSGKSERYYTIDSPLGSLSVSGKTVSLSDEGTKFRLKDMAEGYYAFEDTTQPRYRLEYTTDNGVRLYYYSAGSDKQRWTIENTDSGVFIKNSNAGYLAVKDGAIIVTDEKYEWSLTYKGETPFSAMTSLPGFKLFSEKDRQRIIDICTSVGADAIPFAPNGLSYLDNCESVFKNIFMNRNSLSAQQQHHEILAAISNVTTGSLAESNFYYPLKSFPGSDAAITESVPQKTKHVMWDLVEENGIIYSASDEHPYTAEPVNCYVIKVTYTTETTSQTINVYCVDPDYANVHTAISAFGKFPYNYRKYIKNMYVYNSTTSSTYNCGPNELFVRLGGIANETSMIKSFAHELGHCLDYNANGTPYSDPSHVCQQEKWKNAIADDIVTVSVYGNSNLYEGFAEFARLYFLCYGNRDLEIGFKQLYPNRYKVFTSALSKIGVSIY